MNALPDKNTVCIKEKIILVRFVVVNLTKVNILRYNVQIFYMFLYKENKERRPRFSVDVVGIVFNLVPLSPC
jgi:hypothetical protein